MSKPKIGIVVGSTRPNRFADKPTEWIEKIARARGDIDVEIVDLRDYPLPFFDEAMSPAWGPSQNEVAQKWQKKVAELDGFIFIAAEYNRGPTAVLKNALDYAYNEWNQKAVTFVGYGGVGGGARRRAAAAACGRGADGADAHRRPHPDAGLRRGPAAGQEARGVRRISTRRRADARPARLVDEGAEGGARQRCADRRDQGRLRRQFSNILP